MTTTPQSTSQAFRVVCPPGCKHSGAARMHEHEVEIDIDGTLEVQHEVDFGEWAFGNVVQHVEGRPDEKHVTVSQVEPDGGFTDVAALRRFAADLLNAADWLDSVQGASTMSAAPMESIQVGAWRVSVEVVGRETVYLFSGPRDTFEVSESQYPHFLAAATRAIGELQ